MARRKKTEETASPIRNFTLTTAERVQAIVTGPPAWARRRKRIEELPALIVAAHREGRASEAARDLAELAKLVDAHNAYYPIEANLPFDPETSRLIDDGAPWSPMPRPTLASVLAQAEAETEAAASLAWAELPGGGVEVSFDTVKLRLTPEAFTCEEGHEETFRVETPNIEEITPGEHLDVMMWHGSAERVPCRLDEAAATLITTELNARLRWMSAASSGYRGTSR